MAQTSTSIYNFPWTSHHFHSASASPSTSVALTEESGTISNTSAAVTPGTMDPPLPASPEDVNVVMSQVLVRMDRVVEHLRSRGEHEAANMIARNMINVIEIFNAIATPWEAESSPVTEDKAIIYDLGETSINTPTVPATSSASNNGSHTWASVAAVAPAENNSIVKFGSQEAARMQTVIAKPKIDNVDPDKRVLWIRGWTEQRPLADVTKQIGQGPIYSMTYSPKDTSVCVIFQYARSAKALAEDDEQHTKANGHSQFGAGCDIMVGLAFPDNEDILRMAAPHNERRRLTFARQQLFAHGMTEAKFKADINSIVGPANVELVWLFNAGNATAVFSAVPLARMVRDEFIKYSRQPNSPYRDVHITFSHDPCERPMSLVKQMPAGRDFHEGTYGGESALPVGITTKSASISRRTARDSDGWQTVGRRR